MKAQTYTPDTYGWNTPGGSRQTVTAVEPERKPEPKLYLPNGEALCQKAPVVGFRAK